MSHYMSKVVGIAVLIWLASTQVFGVGDPKTAEKTYIHSLNGVPKNLDPVQIESYYSSLIATSVYDTFYSYKYLKRPYEIKENLASGLPQISKDGKVYTLRIKKGVYFADDACFPGGKGREVTVHDFIYTMKRHMDPSQRSSSPSTWVVIKGMKEWKKHKDYSKPIEGLQAVDNYTLKLTLEEVNPRFIYELTSPQAAFIPREAVEKYGPELAMHPVGSGPFILRSIDKTKAELVKNPSFRKDVFNLKAEGYDAQRDGGFGLEQLDGKTLPHLDRLVIRFMNQETSRWNSFTKGNEIQYSTIPSDLSGQILASMNPPKLKPEYAEKYILRPEPELGLTFSSFNMGNPEIGYNSDPKRNEANKALRCAIRQAFNWPARIQRFYYGLGTAYSGAISPALPGYTPLSPVSVTHDLKAAKKLLAQHNWNKKNMPVLVFGGTASVKHRQMFEQFRGFLKRIGYPRQKIKYKSASTFGDFLKRVNEGKFDYFGMGWVPSVPDPLQLLERYYGEAHSPGSNKSLFKDEKFDALFVQAKAMPDGAERTQVLREMNQIVTDACVAIESFSRTRLNIWHKDVKMAYTSNLLRNQFKYVSVGGHQLSH